MKCDDATEVMRWLSGQLPHERAELLRIHAERCPTCALLRDELTALTARLRHGAEEFRDESAVDEVMALIRMGKADRPVVPPERPSFWKSWQTWLLVPTTAMATALAMLMFWPKEPPVEHDGFQARGSHEPDLDAWVSLEAFRATERGYEPVKGVLAPDDALAFSYLNRPGEHPLRYLAVLGVNAQGKVFWYYPPDAEAERRSGVAIQSATFPIELPEQVVHDLTPGPLRIFGLFSARPLSPQTIEHQVARDFHARPDLGRLDHLGLTDVGQHSLLLRVERPAEKAPPR